MVGREWQVVITLIIMTQEVFNTAGEALIFSHKRPTRCFTPLHLCLTLPEHVAPLLRWQYNV